MTERINKLYTDAGLKPPDGKGIHKYIFHKCVVDVSKDIRAGKMKAGTNAYAICMAQLGRNKAVKKAHRRDES